VPLSTTPFSTSLIIARALILFYPLLRAISLTVPATLDAATPLRFTAADMTLTAKRGVRSPSSSLNCQTRLDNSTRDLLRFLPNELIANILAMLHYRDLASTIQVHLPSFLSHYYN